MRKLRRRDLHVCGKKFLTATRRLRLSALSPLPPSPLNHAPHLGQDFVSVVDTRAKALSQMGCKRFGDDGSVDPPLVAASCSCLPDDVTSSSLAACRHTCWPGCLFFNENLMSSQNLDMILHRCSEESTCKGEQTRERRVRDGQERREREAKEPKARPRTKWSHMQGAEGAWCECPS